MKLTFYMPFKPPDHINPSGDLITGRELRDAFLSEGHSVSVASRLRSRWIYWKPRTLLQMLRERKRICSESYETAPDLWFTYHSYYKAPDMLGPYCSAQLQIPYVIFQGIYSTKRRRSLKTRPGFLLNHKALLSARMVYANKRVDEKNLRRILPDDRLLYIAPGIDPDQFGFDEASRRSLRKQWSVADKVVILAAAMFRPGVKTEGLRQVISSCGALKQSGKRPFLVIAGDGQRREELENLVRQHLGSDHLFLGKIPRQDLHRYYSAADIFTFPGIQESLGMVYLEAQSVGLPVVAFQDWGAREAVVHEHTGLLTPADQPDRFSDAIGALMDNKEMRKKLGRNAREHIRENHDTTRNYRRLLLSLEQIVQQYRQTKP